MSMQINYDLCLETYNSWLNDPKISSEDVAELESIAENRDEIIDRFYRELEFGTAGLRGVLGVGANRMNKYIIAKSTQGYANYLLQNPIDSKKGVVIAFDSRNFSPEFAKETALVLAANGIPVYLYDSMRSVPQLSFSISHLNCVGGIVITASHNPRQYNGYKVYSHTGAQIPPEIATEVLHSIQSISSLDDVKHMDESLALSTEQVKIVGKELDAKYISYVKSLSLNPHLFSDSSMNVVYTPLHGTGAKTMPLLFSAIGMDSISYVEEQMIPDGNFPTVSAPNPEAADAFDMAKKIGEKVDASLLLATDPDSDRLGVCVRNSSGEYIALTGNQIGALLLEYILYSLEKKNTLLPGSFAVRSIVSTRLSDKIAKSYKIENKVVNTGFRFVGELVHLSEMTTGEHFIFGFEESFGYLHGTKVRDKDAICAAMLLVEAALYYNQSGYNQSGKSLLDVLEDLYEKHGYYSEKVKSIELAGIRGQQQIAEIMSKIRSNPPSSLAEIDVLISKDYSDNTYRDVKTGETHNFDESISGNILLLELQGDNWLCIRPSGTEPKIKIYACSVSNSRDKANSQVDAMLSSFSGYLDV